MGGSSTISTSETKIEALKLQSSAYGVTIPVLGGVNRIPGNLIDYVDFKAIAHTTTESQGGKGGGVKTQNTTFTYTASVLMGICQGPIGAISRVWKGKEVLAGGWSPAQLATAVESYTVPGSGAMTYTLAHGATLLGTPSVSYTETYTVYGATVDGDPVSWTYTQTVGLADGRDFSLAGGVLTILQASLRGVTLSIQYQWGSGSPDLSPLVDLGITLVRGDLAQTPAAWLTADHPTRALAYPGLAYVHAQDYSLGSGASVDNHSFEVQGQGAYRYGPTLPDCNLAEFAADVLTNDRYGARMPANTLLVDDWIRYCAAAGLLMSPVLTEQQRAGDFVDTACRLSNSAPVWSYDRLRIVPLGDVAITGNGVTYTPDTTPVYDLDDDSWLQQGDDDPLQWELKLPSDRYNHVRVEFCDRANYYNKTIAEAKDDADISVNGLRTMATISAPWVCDAAVAALVARIALQRSLNITGTGRLRLPWSYCLLEPAELLTLTDAALGFSKLPVRITAISEDEDGMLEIEVEDWPLGTASPARYPSQPAAGYQHNYNASPGDVDPPVLFEAPVDRTVTGLEVYAAVKGSGAMWGGCGVWVSLDGVNYKRTATLYGSSRYGTLTGPISGGNMPVATSGQLISGSAADAAALSTLCWVGGSVQEYLAYEIATLTGPGAYTLSGLVRGGYGTPGTSAHTAGDPFVRVDDAVAKSGPLDLSLIGETISLKFTSFNIFQAGEQSLADVMAYSYTITGDMVELPPTMPTGLTVVAEPFGLRIKVNKNPEPDVVAYEYRQGTTWETATVLEAAGGTSYLWRMQTAGTYTVWVAAVDIFGAVGPAASAPVTLTAPTISTVTATVVGPDLQLDYAAVAGSFAISGYQISYGATFVGSTPVGTYSQTRHTRRVDWAGARVWWVAAVDVVGNVGPGVFVSVTIQPPGVVLNTRSEVVDNNALLYWAPPASGSLPVDRYEVRKGASWAGGTTVGSNGNSTFTAIFEQQAGVYSYWVAAVDTAGTPGTAVAIVATINQPPDYVLRDSFDDDFVSESPTLSGMYFEAGKLYGPALGETIQTHFESRSWASPDAQITAGYPLVFQPSGTSCYFERTIDYFYGEAESPSNLLPATVITVTTSTAVLAGAVTMQAQISYKAAAADGWTDAPAGALQVMAAGFRYVRVRLTFTATGGDDLVELSALNIKISGKMATDSGNGSALASDSGGTSVSFNVDFIDVRSIVVTPGGTAARYAIYDFVDVPYPTSFKVLLFNSAGTRVDGPFSWSARGFS